MMAARTFRLAVAAFLLCSGAAVAEDNAAQDTKVTAEQFLRRLEKVAPTEKTLELTSPKTTTSSGSSGLSSGGTGGRALQNLEKEESGRTQRQILEQLK